MFEVLKEAIRVIVDEPRLSFEEIRAKIELFRTRQQEMKLEIEMIGHNLQHLNMMGVPKVMINELKEMGFEASGIISAMVKLTPEELQQVIYLYNS